MFESSRLLERKRDRLMRWLVLGICLVPLGGAYIYNWGFRLYEGRCFFQQIFGIPSPSCGMTRSFMAIARGDWTTAFSFHAFGPLLFGVFLATAIHVSIELIAGKSYIFWHNHRLKMIAIPISIGVLFFAYYGLRLYVRYSDINPAGSVFQTAIWQSFVAGAKAL